MLGQFGWPNIRIRPKQKILFRLNTDFEELIQLYYRGRKRENDAIRSCKGRLHVACNVGLKLTMRSVSVLMKLMTSPTPNCPICAAVSRTVWRYTEAVTAARILSPNSLMKRLKWALHRAVISVVPAIPNAKRYPHFIS